MTTSRGHYYSGIQQITAIANEGLTLRRACNATAKVIANLDGDERLQSAAPQREEEVPHHRRVRSDSATSTSGRAPLTPGRACPKSWKDTSQSWSHAPTDARLQHPEMAESQHVVSIVAAPIMQEVGHHRRSARVFQTVAPADRSG